MATETVTVVHFGPRDPYGDIPESGREDVSGVLLVPRVSGDAERGTTTQNVLQVDLVAYAPGPAPISATDRIVWAGKEYEVVGEPARWRSPWTGWPDTLEVLLRRVTG